MITFVLPPQKSITGVEWGDNVELIDKVTHSGIALLEFRPLTFPHLYNLIATTFVTSRGDGHASERIELGLLFKEPFENEAAFFE